MPVFLPALFLKSRLSAIHYLSQLIRHYRISTWIDVLHSPFVFGLYNSCIKKEIPHDESFAAIEQIRRKYQNNNKEITFTDFGASAAEKGAVRSMRINQIAKNHLKPARIARILFHLIRELKPKNCIELGSSLGITSAYLASALKQNKAGELISIDACKPVIEIANETIQHCQLNDVVEFRYGTFEDQLEPVLQEMQQVDFCYIDGNHAYEATVNYFKQLLPHCHEKSILVFDDLYWSKGMKKAWEEIISHDQVTVSINLFFIGLVFFKKGQAKEHFRLRVW